MELTYHDKANPLWVRLEKHFTERLELLRAKNDANLDERTTAELRGRIAEIKAILLLAIDKPTPD